MQTTEKIWREFSTKLRGYIRRRVANQTDTEDILHEVFLKIHTRLETLDDSRKINSWLYTLTRNTIIDYYRTQKKEIPLSRETISEENMPPVDDRLEINECLIRLLETLPATYRRALEAADIQELTMRELARQEGLSLSGVKSRIRRGRSKLKKTLLDCCSLEMDGQSRAISMSSSEDCGCRDC